MWKLHNLGGKFLYVNTDTNKKSRFFVFATPYKDGFAQVALKSDENPDHWCYYFRDENGNLSMPFKFILSHFHNHFAIVKTDDEHTHLYSKDGTLSNDSYYSININSKHRMHDVYEVQKSPDSEILYRGKTGKLYKSITEKIMDFLDYKDGQKSVFDIALDCFGDEKMVKYIKQKEQTKLTHDLESCASDDDYDSLHSRAYKTAMYINEMQKRYEKEQLKRLGNTQKSKELTEAMIKKLFD